MIREIKFRAWDMVTVKMVVWEDLLNKHDLNEIFKYGYDLELMQYTGLKDKNDVEIYEGDILRVTDEEDEVNALNSDTGIGVVEWLDKWGFWNISNIENGLGDILCYGYVEIIGNIYEDKHLLGVE